MRLALCLLLATLPQPSLSLELTFRSTHALNRPASLDFDPAFCGLWIANEGPEIVLSTLDGLELRRFGSDLARIKAVTLDDGGLLVADGYGGFQRLTKDGEARGAPYRLSSGWADTEGLAFDGDGTLMAVEDEPGRIIWFDDEGAILRELDGTALTPPMTEPQGIARDPRTGHILVVDDWEGLNSLFEFDASGTLLAVAPLIAYGTDPEGIAIRPSTSTLFIAFDGGAQIASFDYVPTQVDDAEPLPPGADCMMG